MRDRLIELILNAPRKDVVFGNIKLDKPVQTAQTVADHLLANGVIVPPCKVGTTIYMIVEKRPKATREYFRFIKKTKLTFINLERVIREIGKTVFLTKEEAEQALKERNIT